MEHAFFQEIFRGNLHVGLPPQEKALILNSRLKDGTDEFVSISAVAKVAKELGVDTFNVPGLQRFNFTNALMANNGVIGTINLRTLKEKMTEHADRVAALARAKAAKDAKLAAISDSQTSTSDETLRRRSHAGR